MKRSIFLLAVMLVSVPTVGSTQQLPEQLRDFQQRSWYVRISNDTAQLAEGRVRLSPRNEWVVGNSRIDLDQIALVERRMNVGGGWKTGAVVGAVPGGVWGFMLSGLCDAECDNAEFQGTLVYAAVGSLIGAVVGQLVRPPRHEWEQVWPKE